MSMSKKDYQLIGSTIRQAITSRLDECERTHDRHDGSLMDLAYLMATRLGEGNPTFNRAVFLSVCGVPYRDAE